MHLILMKAESKYLNYGGNVTLMDSAKHQTRKAYCLSLLRISSDDFPKDPFSKKDVESYGYES